jgi:hypothetical protein
MNDRIRDAYYQYASEQIRAGIIDHSLDVAILEGKTVQEHMVDVLRAAGKLPDDWERDERDSIRYDRIRLLKGTGYLVGDANRFARLSPSRGDPVRRLVYRTVVTKRGYEGAVLVGLAS